ncbi:hydroxypyruvate reductase-like [Pyrus x bretschneideri]|uniref:hydroxypyruvate reductase-like n=1 Tax=Pyrus x bretschneideri TaxID=225117 RepID=UPI002030B7B0|nr:hydroxypyruvate reductase-like [Pyrus x bretschneideri]
MHSLSKMEVENGEVKNKQKVSRLLFCGSHSPAAETYTREYLKDYPFIQVDGVPHKDVPGVIQNYSMCIVKLMKLDSDLLSRAEKMKLVLQYGVGLEGVDIDSATKFGIKVARIPSHVTGNAASCAEMAIYLMLGLLRKQNEIQISIKLRKVGDPVGETLLGKTVFILGYGNIGIELAKRLRPFGVKIIASKRSWATQSQDSCQSNVQNCYTENLVDEKCVHEDIHKFASIADIVVCCVNLNSETVGIVNKSFISSMRKGALLVNIARGGLLDYEAVSYNLESGHLGGLGIDVAWTEPFDPDDPILKFNNVIITPHVAGVTEYSYRSMAKVVGDAAIQLHEGKPLTGIEFVN